MVNIAFAVGTLVFLFIVLWLSIVGGYRLGVSRMEAAASKRGSIVKLAEGTVFALLGLLIAFTFAGAYERFENREIKIIDEITWFKTAYEHIDLLEPAAQPAVREAFKNYLDARISLYRRLKEFPKFSEELDNYESHEKNLWQQSVIAVKQSNNPPATLLFINAVDKMIEVAIVRLLLTQVHPPALIFVLLIALAALSSFLTGYSMSRYKNFNSIYAYSFIGIMAFTLYIVIDLELPRVGLMRLKNFDSLMVEMRSNLK